MTAAADEIGSGALAAREVVLDASVVVKWLLRDEEDLDRADALLDEIDRGRAVAYAPRQVHVEVAAALRKAVLTERLTLDQAEEALHDWIDVYSKRLVMADNDDLLVDALQRALGLGITLFDSLYGTLADRLDGKMGSSS